MYPITISLSMSVFSLAQVREFELLLHDGNSDDGFGYSVTISKDYAILFAYIHNI